MLLKVKVNAFVAIACATGAGFASAESYPIYNETCQDEVTTFQQASNADDVGDRRHALLLCLADDTYADQNQTPSRYDGWSNTKHFQVFAQDREVKVGDTALAEGVVLSDNTRQCSCTGSIATRGPGDPTDSKKAEAWEVYFTMNVGDVFAGGPNGIEDMKGFLDQVFESTAIPFAPDHQAAAVIARFGDAGTQALQNLYDPSNPAGTVNGGQTISDWNTQPTQDWATNLSAQAASGVLSNCRCPEYRIPLNRSGGNGVPSSWHEAEEFYFSTNNFGALIKNIQPSGFNDVLTREERNQ